MNPNILLILLCAILAFGLGVPGAELVMQAIQGWDWQMLSRHSFAAFANSLMIGLSVAFSATFLGFIVAYATSVIKVKGASVLRALYMTPLFAPSIMPAIGLIYLVGNNGVVFQWQLYGPLGLFLGGLVFALPHAILQLTVNLQSLDVRLLDVAKTLGAHPWRIFRTVILPHARNGLINAFIVTFIITITDFGVPKLLGGGVPILATEIFNQAIGAQNIAGAFVLCMGLFCPALFAYWISFKLKRKEIAGSNLDQNGVQGRFLSLSIVSWGIILAEFSTIAMVIYGSFVTFWPYDKTLSLNNYTFHSSTYGITPWINSLILAFGVAVIGTVFSFLGAWLSQRSKAVKPQLKRLYNTLSLVPLCIPGTVLGLGFAMSFSGWTIFSGVVGGFILLIFNTVIHLHTVANLTAQSTLGKLNPLYEEQGKSLGVSTVTTVRRVIVPLSAYGIKEVFSYLFATAITTISAVVFIYTSKTIVASIAAIDLIDSGFISEGAAMCSLIFLSAVLVRLITLRD